MSSISAFHQLEERRPICSVEFFPPKNEAGGRQLLDTAAQLKVIPPDFVSITYGAGGSTRERTFEYARILQEEYGFEVMPHLTCVGHTREEIRSILRGYPKGKFKAVMALRGDPPKGEKEFRAVEGGLHYASELVSLIQEEHPGLVVGVAGYPEVHPEAQSAEQDLKNLVHKVNQGASFVTTQLFFDNRDYFDFVDRCRKNGISVPIYAGLLPPLSLAQIRRFCGMCGSKLPDELARRMEKAGGEGPKTVQVGAEWVLEQADELLSRGVPGLHFYILNRADAVIRITAGLRERGLLNNGVPQTR